MFRSTPRDVQQRDVAGCLGEVEGLCKRCKFNPGDLQIDPMFDRIDLYAGQRQWPAWQVGQLLRQPETEIAVP